LTALNDTPKPLLRGLTCTFSSPLQGEGPIGQNRPPTRRRLRRASSTVWPSLTSGWWRSLDRSTPTIWGSHPSRSYRRVPRPADARDRRRERSERRLRRRILAPYGTIEWDGIAASPIIAVQPNWIHLLKNPKRPQGRAGP